jgi:hypothetical protein
MAVNVIWMRWFVDEVKLIDNCGTMLRGNLMDISM